MSDLIEALQILVKYKDVRWPTNCSHDELRIMEIDPADVSKEDIAELARLGIDAGDEDGDGYFYSFRFGSA